VPVCLRLNAIPPSIEASVFANNQPDRFVRPARLMNNEATAGVAADRPGVALVVARAVQPYKIPAQTPYEPRDRM
jgi:hypothetical protein